MFTRHVLRMFIAAQLAALAPALHAEPPAKQKSTAKSPKGRSAASLLAAYTPKVKAALGAQWSAAIAPRMSEFSPGNVIVAFKLDADGKVTEFAVTANTSNEPFAKFCEQFVRDTKFETPPAAALTDGQLAIPFTFTIL